MHPIHTNTARVLISAGPTHEPIDAVRYIGNRSSGKLGIAVASAAVDAGCPTTLLLGPVPHPPDSREGLKVHSFQTTADLAALLEREMPAADVLIMAAAVADYRPRTPAAPGEKWRRSDDAPALELEATEDLVAGCARSRRPDQLIVGFALEPAARMLASARDKLERKGIDAIVANPLETLDADSISPTLITADAQLTPPGGSLTKAEFGPWLLERIAELRAHAAGPSQAGAHHA